ncbi:MAG TPA: glucose-6-phosphate dehydrogenase assembly protein OpcA [Solirubrobacteraceae bacterium]|nr:glucose-6-phosphate dehydrogenase assembly protein OpcA [Solirubrobacteraceae bacterium]
MAVDSVWSERDTTPADVEEALRHLLKERHGDDARYVPGRVLNMVCVVDRAWAGEVVNRLDRTGRYHASRTIILAVEPGRRTIDAVATMVSETEPRPGEFALLRETVVVTLGEGHLEHLDTIVDPLVISDLPTLVWSPHGHPEAVDALLPLTQVVLLDSVDEPDVRDGLGRAQRLADAGPYVVDLAWLRSTPWRERVAASFDPPRLRGELAQLTRVEVRHHKRSRAAALLLVGWLGSRLGWRTEPLVQTGDQRGDAWRGHARARRQDVELCLRTDPGQDVPGLAGLTVETATGRHLSLERGPGGLRAHYVNSRGDDRTWTVVGASRGEPGILGEGIRQALLRDPTYKPALAAATTMTP